MKKHHLYVVVLKILTVKLRNLIRESRKSLNNDCEFKYPKFKSLRFVGYVKNNSFKVDTVTYNATTSTI